MCEKGGCGESGEVEVCREVGAVDREVNRGLCGGRGMGRDNCEKGKL